MKPKRYLSTVTYSAVLGTVSASFIAMDKTLKLRWWEIIGAGVVVAGAAYLATQVLGVGSYTSEEIIVNDKK